MSLYKFYINHIHKQSNYRATWMPNRPMKIGTVGILTNGVFDQYTTLEDLGINVEIKERALGSSLKYTSESGVNVATKVAGSVIPGSAMAKADVGFVVEFNKNETVIFEMKNPIVYEIVNLAEIRRAILELFEVGDWRQEYAFVHQLVKAESSTIAAAKSAGAKLEIKADGGVNVPQARLDIADASLGLSVVNKSNVGLDIVGGKDISPLYALMGLKKKFFGLMGANELRSRDGMKPATETEEEENFGFEDVSFKEAEEIV